MEKMIEEWIDTHYEELRNLSDDDAELEIIRYWGYGWYKDYAWNYYTQRLHKELRERNLFSNNLF